MAELREVYEMTTKQMEPDQDSWREQQRKQDRSSRNRRIGAMMVAAVLAGAVVVAVLAAALTDSDRPAPEVADQPTPPVEGGAGLSYFILDLTTGEKSAKSPMPAGMIGASLYALSPDGGSVAYGTCCVPPNFISVSRLDGSNERRITPDGIDAYGPGWSPDGDQLVYQGRDGATLMLGNLFVVDVSTGTVDRITNLPRSRAGGWSMSPSFTPDGERILFHMPREDSDGGEFDLWSVDAGGGKPTIVLRNALFGEYSPDGMALAYVDPDTLGGSALRVWIHPDSTEHRVLARGEEFGRVRWSPDGSRIAYSEHDVIYVVDVATGDVERIAAGEYGDWLDDDRLIVTQRD